MAIVIFSSIKHLIFVWRLKHLFDKEENISCKFYFWGHGLPEAVRQRHLEGSKLTLITVHHKLGGKKAPQHLILFYLP